MNTVADASPTLPEELAPKMHIKGLPLGEKKGECSES